MDQAVGSPSRVPARAKPQRMQKRWSSLEKGMPQLPQNEALKLRVEGERWGPAPPPPLGGELPMVAEGMEGGEVASIAAASIEDRLCLAEGVRVSRCESAVERGDGAKKSSGGVPWASAWGWPRELVRDAGRCCCCCCCCCDCWCWRECWC